MDERLQQLRRHAGEADARLVLRDWLVQQLEVVSDERRPRMYELGQELLELLCDERGGFRGGHEAEQVNEADWEGSRCRFCGLEWF